MSPASLPDVPSLPPAMGLVATAKDLHLEVTQLTALEKELDRLIAEAVLLLRQERQGAFEWSEAGDRYEWRRQVDCRRSLYEERLRQVRRQAKQARKLLHQATAAPPKEKKKAQVPLELLLQIEQWMGKLEHPDAKGWIKAIRIVRSGGAMPATPAQLEATLESRCLAMRAEGKEMREIADALQMSMLDVMRLLLPREKGDK